MVVDFDLGMINFATLTPKIEVSGGEVTGLGVTPPGGNIARVGFHFLQGAPAASSSGWRLKARVR